MSGPMALQRPGSELMLVAPVTTEGCAYAQDPVGHLSPCWYPEAMLIWVDHATWEHGDIQAQTAVWGHLCPCHSQSLY